MSHASIGRSKLDPWFGVEGLFLTCRAGVMRLCGFEFEKQDLSYDYLRWQWRHKKDPREREKFQYYYQIKSEEEYYASPVIKQQIFFFEEYIMFLHDQVNMCKDVLQAKLKQDAQREEKKRKQAQEQKRQEEYIDWLVRRELSQQGGQNQQIQGKKEGEKNQKQTKTTPNKEAELAQAQFGGSTKKKNHFPGNVNFEFSKFQIEDNPQRKEVEVLQREFTGLKKKQDDEVSVASKVEVSDYADKKRISKKTNTAKVFHCKYCDYMHHQLKRITNHKRICQRRKEMKCLVERNQQQRLYLERISMVQEQKEQMNPQMVSMKAEILQLKARLKRLEGKRTVLSEAQTQIQCQHLSLGILNPIKENLFNIIKIQLIGTIKDAVSSGFDVLSINNLISAKLIGKISGMNFDDLLLDGTECLQEAHQQLVKINIKEGKKRRTIRYCQQSKEFLTKYSEMDFYFHSRIIMDLLHIHPSFRKSICLYHRKLRKFTTFDRYPSLPEINSVLPWKQMQPTVGVDSLAQWVEKLFKDGQTELACDIWMIASMGLYPEQLQRIYFFSKEGHPFSSIKVYEPHSRSIVIRYVPRSLVNLVFATRGSVSYPITWKRLANAKKFLTTQLKNFYAFRHLLSAKLVQIMAKIYRFHYFDPKEKYQLLLYGEGKKSYDQYFSLMLKMHEVQGQRLIQLDLTYEGGKQRQMYGIEVTLDSNEQALRGYQLDEFLLNLRPLLNKRNNNEFKSQLGPQMREIFERQFISKEYLIANSMLFNKYNYELSEECSENHLMALLFRLSAQMEDRYLLQEMSKFMQTQGMTCSNENLLKAAAVVLHKRVLLWSCEEIHVFEPNQAEHVMVEQDEEPIILAQAENHFFAAQQQLTSRERMRESKLKAVKAIKQAASYVQLSYNPPKCPQCKAKTLQSNPQKESWYRGSIACFMCNYEKEEYHYATIQTKTCSQVRIINLATEKVDFKHKTIEPAQNINNLKRSVEADFGACFYVTHTKYAIDIPSVIHTGFCHFSKELAQSIKRNRQVEQYLPLQIRRSSIAGKGLFAADDLPSKMIVISYVGTIASTFTANLNGDSLFFLGWLSTQPPRELFITPELGTNAGRYINGSDRRHPPNCKAHIGILDSNEIAVYFYTSKAVAKDEELLFDYGSLYSFKEKNENELKVIVQRKEEIFESD